MSREIFFDDPRDAAARESPTASLRTRPQPVVRSEHTEGHPADDDLRLGAERFSMPPRKPEALDAPRAHYLGDRAYLLRESEHETLAEIGTFRTVAARDLAHLGYDGDTRRMEREIRRLREQCLISENVLRVDLKHTIRLFTLTKKGVRLARMYPGVPQDQVLFHGFVRPREAKHDADLYRLYHAEAQHIAQAGGRVTRVVLDYELQRNLNRELASLPSEKQSEEARERIAHRHGLAFVNGKIPFPDMRIEYDTAEMERKYLDLELATRNYRPRALAEKARAGFSFYAPREDASRLRRVLDAHEITAEILSL